MNAGSMPLAGLLEIGAERSGDGVAALHDGRTCTYARLREDRDRTARALSAQGFRAGDAIALCVPASPEWISTAFAIWSIGGILIDVNPGMPPATRDTVLANCTAAALVTQDDLRSGTVGEPRRLLPAGATGPRVPEGTACINLTSGTTGIARGVILPAINLVRNAEIYIRCVELTAADRTCLVLPVAFGMNKIALLAHFAAGASVILAENFVTPNSVLAAMDAARATGFCLVPSLLHTLLSRADLAANRLAALRYIRVGAGKVEPHLMGQLKRRLPQARVCITYGLTEVGMVSLHTEESYWRRPDSCGAVIPEVRVTTVPNGNAREIVVTCGHAAVGYLGGDSDESQVFQADGIHTGDLGRVDEAGYLYLTGRAKDMIKSGSESIAPAEIEEILRRFPGVEDCAVVPVDDPWLGEAIRAYVVPGAAGTLDLAELREFCKRHLSPIKRPREFRTCAALPRNATGKVDKAALD